MSTCQRDATFTSLELPPEFEDLEGLLHADLRAVVTMLTERAHERLFLTRREHRELQSSLWNGLAEVVNAAMSPLTAESR